MAALRAACRNERTRHGQSCRQTLIVAEPADDRSVDPVIEPIRRGLVREQHAEHGDEDYAANEENAGPPTGSAS